LYKKAFKCDNVHCNDRLR